MLLPLLLIAASTRASDVAQQLAAADALKRQDNAAFAAILKELADDSTLDAEQRLQLRYLEGWQKVYEGRFEAAITDLNQVLRDTRDATLRFRAGVTAVNALAIVGRNEQGYLRLGQVLAELPEIRDSEAREQAMVVAAIQYNLAGQYELGRSYAERLLTERPTPGAVCKGRQLQLEARFKAGSPDLTNEEFRAAIRECERVGEVIYAGIIRTYVARRGLAGGRFEGVLRMLSAHRNAVRATRYGRLIAEFDVLLGEAWRGRGELDRAREYANRAIETAGTAEITEPLVDAYHLLYLVARAQGKMEEALSLHERYMTVDKGYLTVASARAMAFQSVRQQVQARKAEVDALSKRNQVLQLQQRVSKSAAETRGLYILLLLSVLAFIAMWLYKTKRSQLHFMKLARRDGLTGIFNRNHFGDAAESVLRYARRSDREACAIIIDLDHFKQVNDRYGHEVGDQVLQRTVKACQPHLRSIDVMGRLGGEEFGVVLPDCDMERAVLLANRFCESIASLSIADSGFGFPISASLGVTSSKLSGYELRQLLIHADAALYKAKREGRNRIEMFDGTTFEAPPSTTGAFDRRTS